MLSLFYLKILCLFCVLDSDSPKANDAVEKLLLTAKTESDPRWHGLGMREFGGQTDTSSSLLCSLFHSCEGFCGVDGTTAHFQ